VKQSSLVGHNTDGDGFAYSLQELAGVTSVKRALVIGNGGSARAVVYSLANSFGCREFVVFGRTAISLATFQNEFLTRITDANFRLCATDDGIPSGSPIDLVVNCTPLGGWHHPDADPIPRDLALSQSTVYVDLNYNDNNSVVSRARSAGAIALNGAPMLVAQAIKSFELWTGEKVAFEPIFSSVFPDQKLPGGMQR
jgi:shikimate dehydrogenase